LYVIINFLEKIKLKRVPIGSIGAQSVSLPIIEFGSGQPKGVIVSLQHGGELSPLWIIKDLIEKSEIIQGTATIIPVANPFGFILGARNEPIDGKNLNRQFPGNDQGDFTARLAASIFKVCQPADFVIDLHTFSRQSPFLAGYNIGNNLSLQDQAKKIIQLLKPDIIWKVNEGQGDDKRFSGSLDGALAAKGIPSVFIEMPNYQAIDSKMVTRISNSIQNVFNNFNSLEIDKNNIPEFKAKYIFADQAGIFEPKVSLLEKVKAGQVIGTVSSIPEFDETKITSSVSGVVMTIKGNDVIRTGSKIASIGIN